MSCSSWRYLPGTKEIKSAKASRSNELHNTNYMVLNAKHVVVIEPVSTDLRVPQVNKQVEVQTATPPKTELKAVQQYFSKRGTKT